MPSYLQPAIQALAIGTSAMCLLLIMPHAMEYAHDQSSIGSPASGWSDVIRNNTLPIGSGLMLLSCLINPARHSGADLLVVAVVLAVLGGAIWLGGP